jgi:amidophosphoribosyltransferase
MDLIAHRHINTESDSELLLNVLADNLQKTGKPRIGEDDIFEAIQQVFTKCEGGYACVFMLAGFGLIGFRDPYGIRPLVYGSRNRSLSDGSVDASKQDWAIASESVVPSALEFTHIQDLGPGEAIIISRSGQMQIKKLGPPVPFSPCLFEYVYFARPDSIMDGVSVYDARLSMGEALAKQVKVVLGEKNDIDVVIPVPDTSRVAALQAAFELGKPYREGLMKNRYIGRTFIMPGQSARIKSVRRKLNAMRLEFQGKNVLLVDDSVVRGTTSKEIVQMARDAGATKVYFASCAPPVRFPNVYGIDMPSAKELVAYQRSADEVAAEIGADCMIYQDLNDLKECVRRYNPLLTQFDDSVFSGKYVTGCISSRYLMDLEDARSETPTRPRSSSTDQQDVGIFNQVHNRSP